MKYIKTFESFELSGDDYDKMYNYIGDVLHDLNDNGYESSFKAYKLANSILENDLQYRAYVKIKSPNKMIDNRLIIGKEQHDLLENVLIRVKEFLKTYGFEPDKETNLFLNWIESNSDIVKLIPSEVRFTFVKKQ